MTLPEALLTKARRYCMEQYKYWQVEYVKHRKNGPYTDQDYNLFPRYNALDAILQGVELLVGQEFNSLEQIKEALIDKGWNTHTISTIEGNDELYLLGKQAKYFKKDGKSPLIAKQAIEDERKKFVAFIEQQTIKSLENIEPLPFKRKLSEDETEYIRAQLLEHWNFKGYCWIPLTNECPQATMYIEAEDMNTSEKEALEQYIRGKATSGKIYLITENIIDYQVEVSLLDLDLYETIVCDDTFSWVVYGSHEDTLSFGGSFLLDKVKEIFKDRV